MYPNDEDHGLRRVAAVKAVCDRLVARFRLSLSFAVAFRFLPSQFSRIHIEVYNLGMRFAFYFLGKFITNASDHFQRLDLSLLVHRW